MKKILLLLLFAISVNAANITWLGTTSSAKTATNWVGLALPTETDTMVFGATNLGNCVFDSNFTTAKVTVSNSYTGTINLQTYTITCTGNWTNGTAMTLSAGTSTVLFNSTTASAVTSAGKSFYDITVNNASKAFSFADAASLHTLTTTAMTSYTHTGTTLTASGNVALDGSGTLNLGNGVTCTGASSNFHIGSSTTPTATSCAVTMNTATAGVIDDDKGVYFKSLTLGASAITTASGLAASYYSSATTCLTLGNNASLTLNQITYITPTATQSVFSFGTGYTLAGTSLLYIESGGTNPVITIPATTYTGTPFGFKPLVPCTYEITGALSVKGFTIYAPVASCPYTVNTNGNTITNATSGAITIGSLSASSPITINWGASTVNCLSYDGATFNTGVTNFNMGSSTWNCAGNFKFGSNHVVDKGTSTLVKTGGAGTITSLASKPLYNYLSRKNRGIVDSFPTTANFDSIYGYFRVDSGKVLQKKKKLWIGDYYNYATAAGDTVNLDTTVEVRGDWRSFGNRKTDGINSPRIFTGSASPCTTAMVGAGGYFYWRRAKGSVMVDSGAVSMLYFGMDSIGTLKTLDSTYVDSMTNTDSSTFLFASNKGFKTRVWDTASISGVANKPNYYSASSAGTAARLYLTAADTLAHFYSMDCSTSVIVHVDSTGRTGGNNRNIRYLRHLVVAPATGPAAGATPFTVAGRGLIGGGALFGTEAATSWTVASNLSASGVSPAGSGTAVLRVYSSDCGYAGDTVTVAGGWIYISPVSNQPQKNLGFSFGFEF